MIMPNKLLLELSEREIITPAVAKMSHNSNILSLMEIESLKKTIEWLQELLWEVTTKKNSLEVENEWLKKDKHYLSKSLKSSFILDIIILFTTIGIAWLTNLITNENNNFYYIWGLILLIIIQVWIMFFRNNNWS